MTDRTGRSLFVVNESVGGETAGATCDELRLVDSWPRIGDTMAGLLCTDERGSLLDDVSLVLGVLLSAALPRHDMGRSGEEAGHSSSCGVPGALIRGRSAASMRPRECLVGLIELAKVAAGRDGSGFSLDRGLLR